MCRAQWEMNKSIKTAGTVTILITSVLKTS